MRYETDAVHDGETLRQFIDDLIRDVTGAPDEWENPTLDRYVEALSAWVADMDAARRDRGEPMLLSSTRSVARRISNLGDASASGGTDGLVHVLRLVQGEVDPLVTEETPKRAWSEVAMMLGAAAIYE